MTVTVSPSKACGTVKAPPSKSIAHRALICSALSDGCTVENLAFSADITATLDCLKKLGASVSLDGTTATLGGLDLTDTDTCELFCNESGSTLRFLIPLCLLSDRRITLRGSERLFERPLGIYESICREQGLLFEKGKDYITVCGPLRSGSFSVAGDVSSQFISGLLFALPLLDGISIVDIKGNFESASYVDLTLQALDSFGVRVVRIGNRFIVYGGQHYCGNNVVIEGDCSNGAFLESLNFLGGDVTVEGIPPSTIQGDRVYKTVFEDLKKGVRSFDLSDCPDLAPILFAVSATVGDVRFDGTKRLALKESDRARAMAEELEKFGIPLEIGDNYVIVKKAGLHAPASTLNGHNDHRIVMSLAVLATLTGGRIEGAEAVSKSYPDFFEVIKSLGVEVSDS